MHSELRALQLPGLNSAAVKRKALGTERGLLALSVEPECAGGHDNESGMEKKKCLVRTLTSESTLAEN